MTLGVLQTSASDVKAATTGNLGVGPMNANLQPLASTEDYQHPALCGMAMILLTISRTTVEISQDRGCS
jgi:hypothetical protein